MSLFSGLTFIEHLYLFSSWVFIASAATSCSTTLTPSIKPSVASGYQVALVATGLTKPRSIQFDSLGNLLVVQSGQGIANLVFQDDGGTCLSVKSKREVLKKDDVSNDCWNNASSMLRE